MRSKTDGEVAVPLTDRAENPEPSQAAFWQAALASSSILLWIVTHLPPQQPLP